MTPDEQRKFEDRLRSLEQRAKDTEDFDVQALANEKMDQARMATLMSIVKELAIHAGLSARDYDHHFDLREKWWYAFIIQKAEDVAPGLAAEIDVRSDEDDAAPDPYPLLFPTSGEENN